MHPSMRCSSSNKHKRQIKDKRHYSRTRQTHSGTRLRMIIRDQIDSGGATRLDRRRREIQHILNTKQLRFKQRDGSPRCRSNKDRMSNLRFEAGSAGDATDSSDEEDSEASFSRNRASLSPGSLPCTSPGLCARSISSSPLSTGSHLATSEILVFCTAPWSSVSQAAPASTSKSCPPVDRGKMMRYIAKHNLKVDTSGVKSYSPDSTPHCRDKYTHTGSRTLHAVGSARIYCSTCMGDCLKPHRYI